MRKKIYLETFEKCPGSVYSLQLVGIRPFLPFLRFVR